MTSKTIKEKLDSMPLDEFNLLLDGCVGKSKVTSEQAEIISQLEHQMKTQPGPEEQITSLTNAKHSSSLQSLIPKESKESRKNHHKASHGSSNNPRTTANTATDPQNLNETTTTAAAATAKTVIPTCTTSPLTSSAAVGTPNLPPQYYFNCAQGDGHSYQERGIEPGCGLENNRESHSAELASAYPDSSNDRSAFRNKSSSHIQFTDCEAYRSVTSPSFGLISSSHGGQLHANDPSLGQGRVHSLNSNSLKSVASNSAFAQQLLSTNIGARVTSPPPPSVSIRGTSSDGSKRFEELHNRKKGKAKDKDNKKETSYTIPKGDNYIIDEVLKFVEGESLEGKRGNKNKKRGVKSMSLDDDNLSIASKKTDRVSALKNTNSSSNNTISSSNNVSNNNNNNNNISPNSNSNNNNNNNQSEKCSKDNNNSINNNSNNNNTKKGKDGLVKETAATTSTVPAPTTASAPLSSPATAPVTTTATTTTPTTVQSGGLQQKKSGSFHHHQNQLISSRDSDGEDSKSSPNFTVVIRKRKNKTASIASPSGSTTAKEEGKGPEERKGRSRGERRKSVGSVPGSDQSEGSDDGSVRSLPAGECTRRENIPKSCASSGGTPQTSYADIARLTKEEDVKKQVAQTLEDYPSLSHAGGFEPSETSDDSGSDRTAVPTVEESAKEASVGAKQPVPISSSLTSYAAIAKLASHEEPKKETDGSKKEPQVCEDFPELNSTVVVSNSSAVSQDSSSAASEQLLPSPKSDSSAPPTSAKYASNDSAFPQLTVSSSASKSVSQGTSVSSQKTMSSVLSNSTESGSPKVSNIVSAPAPRVPTPTQHHPKAQNHSVASPTSTVVNPSSSLGKPSEKSSGAAAAGANAKGSATATTARMLRSPPTVSLNCAEMSDDASPKSGVHTHHAPVSFLNNNGPKDLPPLQCVNGHLSDSERDREVMKRSDIAGAKMDKSSSNFVSGEPVSLDSGMMMMSQCTEAVVFCGENFKEPPQLPSKDDIQFEFGFNVSEVLDDINKKGSLEIGGVVVPPKNYLTANKPIAKGPKNAPSPPPKDGQYVRPTGNVHSSKQQQPYAGRPPREDRRYSEEKNGTRMQSNNRSDNQGPRRMPPGASEGDDQKPASSMPDAQVSVVSAKVSDVRLPSSSPGMPSERFQSYNKAPHSKPLGHPSSKKPFQTEGGGGGSVTSGPAPEVYPRPAAIVTQYPVANPPLVIGGPVPPPVYPVAGFVTSPTTYPNRLPTVVPSPVTGPIVPVAIPPPPFDPTQHPHPPPPQFGVPPVYSVRSAPAPVAATGQDDHSTTTPASSQQPPPPNPASHAEYGSTTAGPTRGHGPHHHQQHHGHRGYNQVPAHNATESGSVTAPPAPESSPREVNSATTTTTTAVGSLTSPINFAAHFVSPDPTSYSSVNVEDLRDYLGRRQQACQRLKGKVLEIT